MDVPWQIFTLKLILICNIGGLGLLILLVDLLIPKQHRVSTVGWVCAAYSLAVFASPLSVMVIHHHHLQTSCHLYCDLEIEKPTCNVLHVFVEEGDKDKECGIHAASSLLVSNS